MIVNDQRNHFRFVQKHLNPIKRAANLVWSSHIFTHKKKKVFGRRLFVLKIDLNPKQICWLWTLKLRVKKEVGFVFILSFSFTSGRAAQKEGGTQLKLVIDYTNSGQALFKPMRYVRLLLPSTFRCKKKKKKKQIKTIPIKFNYFVLTFECASDFRVNAKPIRITFISSISNDTIRKSPHFTWTGMIRCMINSPKTFFFNGKIKKNDFKLDCIWLWPFFD